MLALFCVLRYSKNLGAAKDFGIRKGMFSGFGMAFLFFVLFGSYALAFWYGGKLVREEDYTPGQLLNVSRFLTLQLSNSFSMCITDVKVWLLVLVNSCRSR